MKISLKTISSLCFAVTTAACAPTTEPDESAEEKSQNVVSTGEAEDGDSGGIEGGLDGLDDGSDPGDPGSDPGDPGSDPGDPGDPGSDPGDPGSDPGDPNGSVDLCACLANCEGPINDFFTYFDQQAIEDIIACGSQCDFGNVDFTDVIDAFDQCIDLGCDTGGGCDAGSGCDAGGDCGAGCDAGSGCDAGCDCGDDGSGDDWSDWGF